MSKENYDRLKVKIREEIFAEHLKNAKQDELVFIDMSDVESTKTFKVPKQLTQEQAETVEEVS